MPRRKKSSSENQPRSGLSINKDKPQQRYAANARERARMRVLSRAFCRLKTTLPWVPADTKLSKLDTLRLAASYIAHLKGILRDETLGSSESSLHPAMSMTWPFGFNRPLGGSGSQEGGSILGSEEDDDDDDEEDIMDEDEDEESISSCTWEEVSPLSSSVKDCIHLDTHTSPVGKGKARGKANSNNSRQVHNKKESSSNLNKQNMQPGNTTAAAAAKEEDFSSNNYCNPNPVINMRPLSQTQHHHHHHQHQPHHHHQQQQQDRLSNDEAMFHHHPFEPEMKSGNVTSVVSLNTPVGMMAVTNLENAPPHLHSTSTAASQNEILVGVGNQPHGMGHDNDSFLDDIHNASSFTPLSHLINHGGNEIQDHSSTIPAFVGFGNSNDLISIG